MAAEKERSPWADALKRWTAATAEACHIGMKVIIFGPEVLEVNPERAQSREPPVDASLESVLMEGCANRGAATLNWILPAR